MGYRLAGGLVAAFSLVAPLLVQSACDEGKTLSTTMTLSSTAFAMAQAIPERYTCSGVDVSPPLAWSAANGARSHALTLIDPDAPLKPFVHWLIFNIPASATSLPEAVAVGKQLADGSRQGRSDFGQEGYRGPCPPPGPAHHYHFTIYALDTMLNLPGGTTEGAFAEAVKDHTLATASLVGVVGR